MNREKNRVLSNYTQSAVEHSLSTARNTESEQTKQPGESLSRRSKSEEKDMEKQVRQLRAARRGCEKQLHPARRGV